MEETDHEGNKKEQEKEPDWRRAIRPAAVIHFNLNLWSLNDFPWVETACQRWVRAAVCVCVQQKDKGSVCTLTSAVQTPHFTASAPLSIAPCSLYAPSLSLYFACTLPPPRHVTRTAIYTSRVTPETSLSLCLSVAVLPAFSQFVSESVCQFTFDFSCCFIDWLSISLPTGHSDLSVSQTGLHASQFDSPCLMLL